MNQRPPLRRKPPISILFIFGAVFFIYGTMHNSVGWAKFSVVLIILSAVKGAIGRRGFRW